MTLITKEQGVKEDLPAGDKDVFTPKRKMTYQEFLKSKQLKIHDSGFDIDRNSLNTMLFEYQKDIVQWALKKGKAAVFSDCGTGKTIMQLEFAEKVHEHTNGTVLIVAPLNVVKQTARTEAEKGSPPHAWGKLLKKQAKAESMRLTPTCVGKIVSTMPFFTDRRIKISN